MGYKKISAFHTVLFSPFHFFEFAMSFNVENEKAFRNVCGGSKGRFYYVEKKDKIYHQVLTFGISSSENVGN